MNAIFSFLGGAAFRALVGQVGQYFTQKQEHKYEMERTKLQGELDAAKHAQDLESIKVQAELGVKTIQVQADADLQKLDATAFLEAQKEAFKPTGIKFVDAWNGSVRPAFATVTMFLWLRALWAQQFVMSDWDRSLASSIAGFYFADRVMRKAGK